MLKGKAAATHTHTLLGYNFITNCKCRVHAYIRNGWDKQLTDLDNPPKSSTVSTSSSLSHLPTDGWKDIKHAPHFNIAFTNAHVIGYFVTRTADDGLPAGDFKSINESASNLYRCGHVQEIQVCSDANSNLCIRAKCLPEMRKDRIYLLEMVLDEVSQDVLSARCGCPAGMGPKASCKHVAALCYALELSSGHTMETLCKTLLLNHHSLCSPDEK